MTKVFVIGAAVKPSQEKVRQVLIADLKLLGIYENMKGQRIEGLSYHSLLSLLAVKGTVAQ